MFVRWFHYTSRNPQPWSRRFAVRAVLVESRRVGGKPRLQHIAMLGSFNPGDLEADRWLDPAWARRHAAVPFWREARKVLDKLADRIASEDRAKIESALEERIPIPTPEDEQQFEADRAAAIARWKEAARSINETFASIRGR
jgi:hypothetical protein